MESKPPAWGDLVPTLGDLACQSARGSVRYRGGDVDDPDAQASGAYQFWWSTPDWWRVEDAVGPFLIVGDTWCYVREGDELQRLPSSWSAEILTVLDPSYLLGRAHWRVERFIRPDDFIDPIGEGVDSTVAGRACWRYRLAPPAHKAHALDLDVDQATRAVLRLSSVGIEWGVEATEFIANANVDPETFTWSGAFSTRWHDDGTDR